MSPAHSNLMPEISCPNNFRIVDCKHLHHFLLCIISRNEVECIESNLARDYLTRTGQEFCGFNLSPAHSILMPQINCPNNFRIVGCIHLHDFLQQVR